MLKRIIEQLIVVCLVTAFILLIIWGGMIAEDRARASWDKAYKDGQIAAEFEISDRLNPHSIGNSEWRHWQRGYTDYLISKRKGQANVAESDDGQ